MSNYSNSDKIVRLFMETLHKNQLGKLVNLPQIAVMGDTSAGKSSLLTAISTIEFPSNNKLTTICPARLTMETSDNIEASVDITWVGTSILPWEKVVFRDDLTGITEVIAKAQVLISSTTTNVSKSIIEITVKGPECTDLTLIDLPGIVHSVGRDENQSLINDIKDLIEEYLNNPRCIILAIIPSNIDYHNAKIIDYIKSVDPKTKRTIAVLTKPDLVEKQTESSVINLIEGRVLEFEYPVYMVKCRNQVELNEKMTLADSFSSEIRYFQNHEVWSTLSNHSRFFGVQQLKEQLSQIQLNKLRSTVPKIKEDIEQKLAKVNEKLDRFAPEFLSNYERVLFVNERLEIFIGNINLLLDGEVVLEDNSTFHSKLCQIFSEYQEKLSQTSLANLSQVRLNCQVNFNEPFQTGRPTIRTGIVTNISTDKYTVVSNSKQFEVKVDEIQIDNTFLSNFIRNHRSKEVPCILDAKLFNQVVKDYVKQEWENLFKATLNKSNVIIKKLFTFHDVMISLNYPGLDKLIKSRLNQLQKSIYDRAYYNIEELLKHENEPYTQSMDMFKYFNAKEITSTLVKLNRVGLNQFVNLSLSDQIDKLAKTTNNNISIDDQISIHLFNAIEVYGKIAYSRVLDILPQIIRSMVNELEKSIRKATIFESTVIEDCMTENNQNNSRRAILKEEKRVLELAMDAFDNFVFF